MSSAAPLLADLFLALAAVIGLITLHRVITSRGPWEPLNRRFLFGIRVTTMLFACRALGILTGIGLFYTLMIIAAALIPVAVLILTEGLLRRHAPRLAKLFVIGGALLFALWAILPLGPYTWRLYGLLAFQATGLALSGWLVLSRDKNSLTGGENRAVERLGLSLFLLIPLAAVDSLTVTLGIPVQASPLAVLFLCWLAIGLGGSDARHRGSLYSFAAVVLAAVFATVFMAVVWSMTRDEILVAAAVILAATLVSAVVNEARHQRADAHSLSMLRHMAQADGDALRFLRGLQDHPMVEGAAVIGAEELADLDAQILHQIFSQTPVLRRADLRGDGVERDHAQHLFARYDASHIFWVSGEPLRLVALSMPSVAASSTTELELAAVQRMAALMAQKAG